MLGKDIFMENFLSSEEMAQAVSYVGSKIDFPIQVGLVLGSGLGGFASLIEKSISLDYKNIPNFPVSNVQGHDGQFIAGFYKGVAVAVMKGRVHYYEGHGLSRVVMGVRLFSQLGIGKLILTNAAGSVNVDYNPGDFMIIEDHINLLGANPLRGPNDDAQGPRFVDLSQVYCPVMRKYAEGSAKSIIGDYRKGVYAAMSGPSYETPAEIKMLRTLGADAVGMSTVPEAIVARHSGMQVLGISLITNYGAGVQDSSLDHSEVIQIGKQRAVPFQNWLGEILKEIDKE